MTAYVTAPTQTRVRPASQQYVLDTSDAGKPRIADLEAEVLYSIEITHPLCSSTERDTIETFWTTNKATVVDVAAADGHTYECPLVGAIDWRQVSASRQTGTVTLAGNRVVA